MRSFEQGIANALRTIILFPLCAKDLELFPVP